MEGVIFESGSNHHMDHCARRCGLQYPPLLHDPFLADAHGLPGRLAEAEPLMRRALSILRSCKRTTGYEHPHLSRVVENYRALLEQMGRSPEEIKAQLDATGFSG